MSDQIARIDLKFPPQGVSWSQIKSAVLELDQISEVSGLWFFDHLASVATGPNGSDTPMPIFDGWSLLASVAAISSRLRVGLMVASVSYRPLGVLANTVSSIDQISGGRLDLGLGAGNNAEESRSFGIDFGEPRARIQQLDEYGDCLQLLWGSREPVSYRGMAVNLNDARLELKPYNGRVPIWIGGKGEKRTLKVVAKHADYWNFSNGSTAEFALKLRILNSFSQELGRPLPIPSVQVQLLADPSAAIETATNFFDCGARHFVLYVVPQPSQIEAAIQVAVHLSRSLNSC